MNRFHHCVLFLLAIAATLITPLPTSAELPSIRLDRIQPLGLSAGSSLEIEAIGRDFEEVKAIRFDHPGLTAEFVKDNHFKVSAKGDLAAGTYEVRMVGKYGISNPRLLSVTRGLADVVEMEPNNEPA